MKVKQLTISSLSAVLLSSFSFTSFAQSAIEPLPPLTNAKGDIIEKAFNADTTKKPRRVRRSVTLENTAEIKDWFNKSPVLDSIEGSGVDRVSLPICHLSLLQSSSSTVGNRSAV